MTVWGMTFATTKQLLAALPPTEILLLRFLLGYAALWALAPRPLPWQGWRAEARMAVAGALGIALYFHFENLALTHARAGLFVRSLRLGIRLFIRRIQHISGNGCAPQNTVFKANRQTLFHNPTDIRHCCITRAFGNTRHRTVRHHTANHIVHPIHNNAIRGHHPDCIRVIIDSGSQRHHTAGP